MKTVRFSKLVEDLGKPEPYTLWVPPEKDSHLQAAIKAHRVMTVHQENRGGTTDFGEVGFEEHVQGSFLIFPKSLKRYEGRRIIGIKYDLLEEPPAAIDEPPKKSRKPQAEAKPKTERKAKPKPLEGPRAPTPKFEPLRVFEPAEAEEPAKPAKPKEASERESSPLAREIRKAMKKLEQGNAVAAYQILEKAVKAD